jgi:hypothetical protein
VATRGVLRAIAERTLETTSAHPPRPAPAFARANQRRASVSTMEAQTMTHAYFRIARSGEPISPATNPAKTAGAGGVRESGDTIQSRTNANAALSD